MEHWPFSLLNSYKYAAPPLHSSWTWIDSAVGHPGPATISVAWHPSFASGISEHLLGWRPSLLVTALARMSLVSCGPKLPLALRHLPDSPARSLRTRQALCSSWSTHLPRRGSASFLIPPEDRAEKRRALFVPCYIMLMLGSIILCQTRWLPTPNYKGVNTQRRATLNTHIPLKSFTFFYRGPSPVHWKNTSKTIVKALGLCKCQSVNYHRTHGSSCLDSPLHGGRYERSKGHRY